MDIIRDFLFGNGPVWAAVLLANLIAVVVLPVVIFVTHPQALGAARLLAATGLALSGSVLVCISLVSLLGDIHAQGLGAHHTYLVQKIHAALSVIAINWLSVLLAYVVGLVRSEKPSKGRA